MLARWAKSYWEQVMQGQLRLQVLQIHIVIQRAAQVTLNKHTMPQSPLRSCTWGTTHLLPYLMHLSQLIFKWLRKTRRAISTDRAPLTSLRGNRATLAKSLGTAHRTMVKILRTHLVESSSFHSKGALALFRFQNKRLQFKLNLNRPVKTDQLQVSELKTQVLQLKEQQWGLSTPSYKPNHPLLQVKIHEETGPLWQRSTLSWLKKERLVLLIADLLMRVCSKGTKKWMSGLWAQVRVTQLLGQRMRIARQQHLFKRPAISLLGQRSRTS
jgi:hypothetical protein